MKALIVYNSTDSKNRKFAEAIAFKIQRRFDTIEVKDFKDTSHQDIDQCDVLYLGTATKGFWFLGTKPDNAWADFVTGLPAYEGKKTVLFTTYTYTTSGMFHQMKESLHSKKLNVIGSMKSRFGNVNYNSFMVLRYSVTY
jgi:flavodoxin